MMKLSRKPNIVRVPKLSDQISDFLISEIDSGTLKAGEFLPSEAELSEQFNVSRTVIREALGRLKYDGLLESSQGSRSKVAADGSKRVFRMNQLEANNLGEIGFLYEFRAILESEAAALAAKRRTDEDLDEMKKLIAILNRASEEHYDGTNENVNFHKRVTEASKNPYLFDFMEFLGSKIRDLVQADRDSSKQIGLPPEVQEEHIAIFEAISQKEPEEARKAVKTHIQNAAKRRGLNIL
jgi:GntR family transcriptional regulator, transcriptional repressor for pyruvate dehydrogenase complex